eukprot:3013870-Alexandrium_andersonii.AAC.1
MARSRRFLVRKRVPNNVFCAIQCHATRPFTSMATVARLRRRVALLRACTGSRTWAQSCWFGRM